jgi:23S rRNA pseudouridine1911/1915/1917 synthase
VGDLTYGADPTLAAKLGLRRQWLHAAELEFTHPTTNERVQFSAELAPDLAAAQDLLANTLN